MDRTYSEVELTKDTPYLALMGGVLRDVYCEDKSEKWFIGFIVILYQIIATMYFRVNFIGTEAIMLLFLVSMK